MQQAGFYHANMLATQMQTTLKTQNNDMMAILQEVMDSKAKQEQEKGKKDQMEQHQKANAITVDNTQLEIMKLLQKMQQTMKLFSDRNLQKWSPRQVAAIKHLMMQVFFGEDR